MKILLTGAAGFLSSHISKKLVVLEEGIVKTVEYFKQIL